MVFALIPVVGPALASSFLAALPLLALAGTGAIVLPSPVSILATPIGLALFLAFVF